MNTSKVRLRPGAAIIRDGAILLTEEYDDRAGLHYNFPGGGLEPGETIHQSLRREVLEETGVEVEIGRLLLVYEYDGANPASTYGPGHEVGFVFECVLPSGMEPRKGDGPGEFQLGIRWVPLEALGGINLLPRISNRLLAALRASGDGDLFVREL